MSVALLGASLLLAASARVAAPAIDVRFDPTHPRLGDTVSVFVTVPEGAPAPTVVVGGSTHPAFALEPRRYRAFVPISPLDRPGRWGVRVESGTRHRTERLPVSARRFGVQRLWLRGSSFELSDFERAQVGRVKALATEKKEWTAAFRAPAGGRVSSPYGVRRYRNGVFLTDYYHRGIDFAPGAGAKVIAPADGTVVLVGLEVDGFRIHGNTVGIDHGHGVVSLMLHLSRIVVRDGDRVQAGDPVGLVGGTGAVTAPHLHWGLYVGGVAVDPAPWMRHAVE